MISNTTLRKYIWCLLACTCAFTSLSLAQSTVQNDNLVVLVSFDGFRNDYVEKFNAPNFKAFIAKGSAAKGLMPSYPSKTFPNHYTIVTGMYPGNHGLVDNNFYDKKLGRKYTTRDRSVVQDPVFYGGLPLWQLAQQNGLKTASFFWVGSEAPIHGQFPTYYYLYDGNIPNEQRVDQAISWLQLPDSSRPRLITLYFSLIDDAGHAYGPNADLLGKEVIKADSILGRLMRGLDTLSLPVNVVLTSDHGMKEMHTTRETYIVVDDLPGYADSTLRWISNGTHAHIYSKESTNLDSLEQALKDVNGPFTVWTRETFPYRWHFQNDRVGDIFLVADPGHYFTRASSRYLAKIAAGEQLPPWGTHGFDPGKCPEMYGIFYANGPAIKPGFQVPLFENVHIYPLVANLLGLPIPEGIDGKSEVLAPVLRKQ